METTAFSNSTNRKIDQIIQNFTPKLLIGTIFIFFLYLIDFFSAKLSFVFSSNLEFQKIYPLSFYFYILSILTLIFLVFWLITISRSIIQFFSIFFPKTKENHFQFQLFKLSVILFSFLVYLLIDLFSPGMYLILGLLVLSKEIEIALSLQFGFFPLIVSEGDYINVSSFFLLCSCIILVVIVVYFFILHSFFFIHKRAGLSSSNSWILSTQLMNVLFFICSPILLVYLFLLYYTLNNVFPKLIILITFLTLILWIVFKISSNYYYGFSNDWVSKDISIFSLIIILVIFFVFPVIFWFIHDSYYFYIYTTSKNTILDDFGRALIANGLVSPTVLSNPASLDPTLLLILTLISVQRILLIDILIILLSSFAILTYMQFKFILIYFKSKLNNEFRIINRIENRQLSNFNDRILNSKILHYLFVLFVLFLIIDILVVTGFSLYSLFLPKTSISITSYIIISALISFFNQIQSPFNSMLVFWIILLFIATLIIFNTVAINSEAKTIQNSYIGAISLFISSFVLIIAYLVFDLQNTSLNPFVHFAFIPITTYISLTYNFLLFVVYYCDTLFMLIILSFFLLKLYNRSVIPKKGKTLETSQIITDKPIEKSNVSTEATIESKKLGDDVNNQIK